MRILVHHDGQQLGPYALEEVRAALDAGSLNATDLAWIEGTPSWVALSSIVGAPAGSPLPVGGLPSPVGAQPYAFPPAGGQTSGLAIASLVLGIASYVLCLFLFASIPGIICGHLARGKIRDSQGRLRGEGLALGGLICGYLNLALLPIIIAIGMPFAGIAGDAAKQAMDATMVAQGCRSYAAAHQGTYPATLEELAPKYLMNQSALHRDGAPSFDYFVAGETNPAPHRVMLAGRKANQFGQRIVARVSGSVQMEMIDPKNEPLPESPR